MAAGLTAVLAACQGMGMDTQEMQHQEVEDDPMVDTEPQSDG